MGGAGRETGWKGVCRHAIRLQPACAAANTRLSLGPLPQALHQCTSLAVYLDLEVWLPRCATAFTPYPSRKRIALPCTHPLLQGGDQQWDASLGSGLHRHTPPTSASPCLAQTPAGE